MTHQSIQQLLFTPIRNMHYLTAWDFTKLNKIIAFQVIMVVYIRTSKISQTHVIIRKTSIWSVWGISCHSQHQEPMMGLEGPWNSWLPQVINVQPMNKSSHPETCLYSVKSPLKVSLPKQQMNINSNSSNFMLSKIYENKRKSMITTRQKFS